MCSPEVLEGVRVGRRGFLGLVGAAAVVGVTGAARPARATVSLASGELAVQDLTHTLSPDFPLFPGYDPMEIEDVFTIEDDGFAAKRLTLGEHSGTHMDAPVHFDAGNTTADAYPVENFFAPLAVVDISGRGAEDADATVTADDLLAWEEANGPLPAGAFVAMYSGWEERVSRPEAFVNADDSDVLHFPGFSPEAADLLVSERDIVGVGVDTLSLDPGISKDFATHNTVLPAGAYGLENLANLGRVAPAGATIFVGGPKHQGATGGPARVFALSPPSIPLPDTGGADASYLAGRFGPR